MSDASVESVDTKLTRKAILVYYSTFKCSPKAKRGERNNNVEQTNKFMLFDLFYYALCQNKQFNLWFMNFLMNLINFRISLVRILLKWILVLCEKKFLRFFLNVEFESREYYWTSEPWNLICELIFFGLSSLDGTKILKK